jgi:hypothetical protein
MVTFKSEVYPALNVVRADGSSLQFSGGIISVEDADADRLRQVAEQYPQYGIQEVGLAAPAPDTEGGEDEVEVEGKDPTNDELREELKARGLPTTGNKEDLILRLAESDAEGDGDDEA